MRNISKVGIFIFFLVLLNTQRGGALPNGNRIINGPDAPKNQYPWLVYLHATSVYGVGSCGGTILNSRYVLTAAHCMFADANKNPGHRQPFHASEIKVYVGAHNLKMRMLGGVQEVVRVSRYVIHTGYRPHDISWIRWDNDYSILELMRDIILPTRTVSWACLSIPLDVGFVPVIAAGWGETENGRESETLKHVVLKTITRNNCASNYQFQITENMICTEGWEKGICSGDSGGPLMTQDGKVIGVTSWVRKENGRCLNPSVFARVTPQMIRWIKRNTQGNIC